MNILIVDDDRPQLELLEGFLKKQKYNVFTTTEPKNALKIIKDRFINLVISDLKMPEIEGDILLKEIKKINPEIRFILITAYGTIEKAVEIMKEGADDFIQKPINLKELLEKIKKIEEETSIIDTIKKIEKDIKIDIPFKNRKILEIYKIIYKISPKDINVLITGESGSGKEVIAKTIHKLSKRAKNPFIAVNCAAIPENLFESEFFGHTKGAFTGAISSRKGKFELANKGTLFLDEVGEIPIHLQGKLLRVLQERVIEPVGSEKLVNVDVRIISATNKNLKEMVKRGKFREDLFFRLNVIEINLPPLRERKEDIPVFIDYFLEKFSSSQIKISPEAKDLLLKYSYPGNIRELENIIYRAVALCSDNIITPDDLPDEIKYGDEIYDEPLPGISIDLNEEVEKLEKKLILSALKQHNWNKSQAAKSLNINERVLRYKIKKYNIQT